MKKILITGAGGTPAVNFVRSLRAAPEKFYFIGTDCDKFYLQRSETDEKYLIPKANDVSYIPVLKDIIEETGAKFLHTQNDLELGVLSRLRDKLKIRIFFPGKKTVELCQNKLASSKIWAEKKLPQPKTLPINDENDLKEAFKSLGSKIWIREVQGAAGKGSLLVQDYKIAKSWIDFKQGWGSFMAAEYLSPQSITWQSLWKEGKLIVAQSRKRIYWEFSDRSPSGITGLTGTGVTVSDEKLDKIAKEAKELGAILEKLPKVLKEATGAAQIYLCCFTEMVPHAHFHFIPRYPEETKRTIEVFALQNEVKAGRIPAVDPKEAMALTETLKEKL